MTKIFIDTNILLSTIFKDSEFHSQSLDIIRDLSMNNRMGIVSALIINEFHYIVLKTFNHQVAESEIAKILDLPQLHLVSQLYSPQDIIKATKIATKYKLKTTDAFHAYYCKKLKIRTIATFDTDFARIPWLTTIPS